MMQSPFYFIAKPIDGKRYSNTRDIAGVELIVNVSEEDHRFSNREARVVELPLGYKGPIKKDDVLLVHHNTFKFYNDMKGRRKSGKSFFKEDQSYPSGISRPRSSAILRNNKYVNCSM